MLAQSLEDYLSLVVRERGEVEVGLLEHLKSFEGSSSPHVDQRLPPMNHLPHASSPQPPPHPPHSQAPFLSLLC